jgi:phenylalanyl-tRNA synthetase beta chain
VPRSPQVGNLTPYQRDRRLLRDILVGAGVSEAQTPSLVGPSDHPRAHIEVPLIRAANAMILEESILRASLVPGLLRAVAFNAARRSPDVALFEIGMVWNHPSDGRMADGRDASLPQEDERLGVALAGRDGDAIAAKRVLDEIVHGLRIAGVELHATVQAGLHPGRTARVVIGGENVGVVGEIDPSVVEEWGIAGRVGWIDLDLRRLLGSPKRSLEQQPVSRFPSSDIDLAFVLNEATPAALVERALRDAGGDVLVDLRLFDVYRGDRVPDGTRGLAFRLRLNADDRTLTDEEIGDIRERAIAAVEQATGATLRS